MEASAIASIVIRNLDPRLKETLRVRAAKNGRSMEAELREIVRDALKVDMKLEENLAVAIRRQVEPFGGLDIPEHPDAPSEPPRFD